MDAELVIAAVKAELQRHTLDTFPTELPTMANGGRGVIVTGCPTCKVQFQSTNQFVAHLADVLPDAIRDAMR
jgi:Fe-S oxidoreductase